MELGDNCECTDDDEHVIVANGNEIDRLDRNCLLQWICSEKQIANCGSNLQMEYLTVVCAVSFFGRNYNSFNRSPPLETTERRMNK